MMKEIIRPKIDHLDFDKGNGLIPVIIQDAASLQVLMQAYMNREALEKTMQTGRATFFSRSKNRLWTKGESSGNFLDVEKILSDCDNDCLLVMVRPAGPACHTGSNSCFFNTVSNSFQESNKLFSEAISSDSRPVKKPANIPTMKEDTEKQPTDLSFIAYLEQLLRSRRGEDPEKSYTARLFAAGSKRIAKKLGEEAVELALEAEHGDAERFTEEAADLIYHFTVLLLSKGLGWEEVINELKKRHGE